MPETVQVSFRGSVRECTAHVVLGSRVLVSGRLLRVAQVFDEDWLDEEPVRDPQSFIADLHRVGVRADILTFAQKLPNQVPRWELQHDFYNLAVAPSADYKAWWDSLPQETRKHVRKSQRLGLQVRETTFDDALVDGIKSIYDETPVRQGRKFWHYGKQVEAVRAENATYLDRSILIGAYLEDELVGFLKMVRIGNTAHIMQIISKVAHLDKKTMNALIAKAAEVCSSKGIESLVYSNYVYGRNEASSLTEFKRRNGFAKVLLPRYFVPLTLWGRFCLAVGAHRGLRHYLPLRIERMLFDLRGRLLNLRAS